MNNPSRRHFLEGAAATIAGAAVLSSGTAEAAAKKGSKGTASYDLIIVGAGCGGLVCAVRAAQIGLKPLLLEKMMDSSGNTIYAAGFMLGTNTKMQRAAGISGDTTDKFYDDMIKVSKGHGDPALTRYFVDHADQTLEWMADYCGIKFKTGMHFIFPMLTRSHLVQGPTQPGGSQLALDLQKKAKSLGVKMMFNTKVVQLLQNSKGFVDGVRVKTKDGYSDIRSRGGVVLATGGFSANQAMVTQYAGAAAARMPIRGSRIIAGENIKP